MSSPRILVVGEINADLVLQGFSTFPAVGQEVMARASKLVPGSASAICACGLARLGNAVTFLGKAGDDFLGRFCIDEMARAGIDVGRISAVPGASTGITVSLSSGGDRALVTCLGVTATISADDVDDEVLESADHLHVSSFFLQRGLRPGLPRLLGRARSRGLTTSLDPGHDPAEGWDGGLREALAEVDVFFPNEAELRTITGDEDVEEALASLGALTVAAKLGSRGAAGWHERSLVRVPAPSVEAVDTTGAGDSFDAGFLHAWLRKKPFETCLRYGVAAGALSTRALGGTSAQPGLAELERFLERHY